MALKLEFPPMSWRNSATMALPRAGRWSVRCHKVETHLLGESRTGSATSERLAQRLLLVALASGAAGGRAPPRLLARGTVLAD